MGLRTKYENDPQDATTLVDGMDITEMLRNPNYTTFDLCKEAADEIDFLRSQLADQKDADDTAMDLHRSARRSAD